MRETDYLKDSDNLIRDLQRIPTFSAFSKNELDNLLRMSKIRKYKKDEMIIKEGSKEAWIYFLVKGEVRVEKEDMELSVMDKRGDIFGEMGVLQGGPRTASVYAVTPTVCLATNAKKIKDLSRMDRIAFGYILYRSFAETLAERLSKTNEELVNERERISLGTIVNPLVKKLKTTLT